MSGPTLRRAGSFAISASGPTRFDHVTIEDGTGLALYFSGPSATLSECTFSRNRGGAIQSASDPRRPDSVLRLRRTTFRDNRGAHGGAIEAISGAIDLDGATFVGNHATESGGAIAMTGFPSALRAVNTTFSGNTADGSGGALWLRSSASATLAHTTFVGNAADANRDGSGVGGAIAVEATPALSLVLTHSVLAANAASRPGPGGWLTTPSACSGSLHASGPNIFDLADCRVTGIPPTIGSANLSPLQDNGGRTPTHLPLAGSPAIDAGYAGVCVAANGTALDRDQRGHRRPAGPACDLGAVEAGGAAPTGGRFDLNGDGKSDLLWEHTRLPWRGAWLMNGAAEERDRFPIDDFNWDLVTADDVDGDAKADLVWRHRSTGHIAIWLMDGFAVREAGLLPTTAFGWRLAGTGDVDGDGRADLVWEQEPRGSGAAGVWFMDGTALKGFRRWQDVPGWSIAGVADASGDGTSDLLWQHTTSGDLALWVMANGAPASGALLPSTSPSGWAVAGFEDLNGDRKADIVWRQDPLRGPGTAVWLLDEDTILTTGDLPSVSHELWTLAQVRDTDGDGRGDLIWRSRGPDGQNARWRMDGVTLQAVELLAPVPDDGWRIR